MDFRLGLRLNQHEVCLIRTGDGRTQLGRAWPNDQNRRERIPFHWGQQAQSPRKPEAATINTPLSPRAQAILSWQLPPEERALVNGEIPPSGQSRKDYAPGLKARVQLGAENAIAVEANSTPARRRQADAPFCTQVNG